MSQPLSGYFEKAWQDCCSYVSQQRELAAAEKQFSARPSCRLCIAYVMCTCPVKVHQDYHANVLQIKLQRAHTHLVEAKGTGASDPPYSIIKEMCTKA